MATIAIRTIIIYTLLSVAMRMMGKREIGELDIGELVSTLLISEIVAIPIDDPDIPLLNAVIPLLLILSMEIIISTIKNRSEKMKRAFEGAPAYIIYKGRLLQSALKENRISVNELLSELRSQGIGNIDDVYYAIIEQNGAMSVTKKGENDTAHAVIIDGEVLENAIDRIGYGNEQIYDELESRGVKCADVFLMTVTDDGKTSIILKEIDR